jgi:flotillin
MSGFFGSLAVIAITILVIVAALALVGLVFAKNYIKVPRNKVAVFTGGGKSTHVRGAARLRIPLRDRVDEMDLTPFNVNTNAQVRSKDNILVTIDAIAVVRFGTTDEALTASTERFLTSPREDMHKLVTERLSGSIRSIAVVMDADDLNGNIDGFRTRVLDEATKTYGPMGMELDGLNIQSIRDDLGYFDAKGELKVATAKSEAEIGKAEARRDADIKTAEATQVGQVAKLKADEEVANAQQDLDLRRAEIQEEVDAANAKAAQAGPLAAAEARRKVELANVQTDREKTAASIEVERQRAEKAKEAAQADVVIPAQAAREAAVETAEGEKAKTIADGQAEAERRKAIAAAELMELQNKAAGRKAEMLAEADGQERQAAALKAFTAEAARLQILPKLIETLPALARELAAPLGNIDKVVVVDNGGSEGGNALTRFASSTTSALPMIKELAGAVGLDLDSLLGAALKDADSSTSKGTVTVDAPSPHLRDNHVPTA